MTFAPLEKKVSEQINNKTFTHSSKLRNKEDQHSFGSPSFGNHHLQRSIDPSFNLGNISIYDKIQRKENTCPCGGGCPRCSIQAKLKVSQPGDLYEQEADRVAEQVMRMSADTANRKCTSCEMKEDEETKIQRKSDSIGGFEVSHRVTNDIHHIKDGGTPMDPSTKIFMESRFKYNFSNVRIHVDDKAAMSANVISARAYTVGKDIVFGQGEYNPATKDGQRLIAHELAHVVQQQTSVADRRIQRDVGWAKRGPLPDPYGEIFLLNSFAEKFLESAKMIFRNSQAMDLVKEAEDAGAKFGGYAEDGPGKKAWPYTIGDTVYVPKASTDPVLAMRDFLFELNNAIRKPKFAEIDKEAAKGSKGKLSAKEYAYKIVELEVEGMLKMGEIWFEMKKSGPKGKEWDKYDNVFFLSEYQAFKDGKKKKEDIIKDVLKRVRNHEPHPEWTVEDYYMDQYKQLSGGK